MPSSISRPLVAALLVFALRGASARAQSDWPPPALVLSGTADHYAPLGHFELHAFTVEIRGMVAGRAGYVSAFPVDRYGATLDAGVSLSPVARLGIRIESDRRRTVSMLAEVEADLGVGAWTENPILAGTTMPDAEPLVFQARKAYARLSLGNVFHFGAGLMTSHWGMGLVSNDGAHGWEPGSARFSDPRSGSRVLRGFVGTGPLTRAGLVATLAVDRVVGDHTLLPGDEAVQFIGALLLGFEKQTQGGVYIVHRRQQAADGNDFNVTVFDAAIRSTIPLARHLQLTLEGEAVAVTGNSTLAPTPEVPRHDVLQIGAAARATLSANAVGAVVDFLYATGDGNFDDRRQTAFKADPNYEMGLLLFRYVQAAQTGRASVTAGDPNLVGVAPQNIDRFATRGGASNTVLVFPRFYVRPVAGLEFYGGPLIAFAASANADPLNSRLAGGGPRNALDGRPGNYYGTEMDLGLRFRTLLRGTELTVGAEWGLLSPGSALRTADGGVMGMVQGGRFIIQYRL